MRHIAHMLEQFVTARKETVQRVTEQWGSAQVKITSTLSYNAAGQVVIEDIVVESRPQPKELK